MVHPFLACSTHRQAKLTAAATAEAAANRQAQSATVLASWRATVWSRNQTGSSHANRSSRKRSGGSSGSVRHSRTPRRQQLVMATSAQSTSNSSSSSSSTDMQQNGSSLEYGQTSRDSGVTAPGAAPTGWHPLDSPSIWKVGGAAPFRREQIQRRGLTSLWHASPSAACWQELACVSGISTPSRRGALPDTPTPATSPSHLAAWPLRVPRSRRCFARPHLTR